MLVVTNLCIPCLSCATASWQHDNVFPVARNQQYQSSPYCIIDKDNKAIIELTKPNNRKRTMLLALTIPLLLSITYASCTLPKKLHRRSPLPQDPPEDITAGNSPISIDLPTEWLPAKPIELLVPPPFLPPPWTPNADIDSPYPSSGVSPWDDSGRSQMVDDMPLSSWRLCPEKRLDCGRCPGDERCRRYPDTSSTLTKVPSTAIQSTGANSPTPSPSAPTTNSKPESDKNRNCPFLRCSPSSAFLQCGTKARCTRGFCVCDLGWKGSWRHGVGARGTEGLGTLTVYQEPGVDCDTRCDSLGCGEVDQVDVGECWKRDGEDEMEGHGRIWDDNEIGPGELDTDTVVSGAIGLPGGDYVEGLAEGGENY